MKISSRIRRDVTVVSVHGRVLRHRADVFEDWIVAEMGDRWSGPVLLDARAMTYINSAGLRTVLRLFKRIAQHGGDASPSAGWPRGLTGRSRFWGSIRSWTYTIPWRRRLKSFRSHLRRRAGHRAMRQQPGPEVDRVLTVP